MKAEALLLVKGVQDPIRKLNLLREYLQAFVLRSLHESEAFQCLSFVGGTALRFLFHLPRFSEDLDFSLESPAGYHPEAWLKKLKSDLSYGSFKAAVTWNDRKTVHTGWIKLSEILQETGLAAIPQQKISIKLEIDTRPLKGARLENRIVNRHVIFALRHHDLASLMSGKIHALCTRPYTKGRDWYDLAWYRSQRPPVEPNLVLLQNAFLQTEGGSRLEAPHWARYLLDRLEAVDLEGLEKEISPFLERVQDAALLTREYMRQAITGE
jgi:predicted nucleotidyltransferase component of viral defense system